MASTNRKDMNQAVAPGVRPFKAKKVEVAKTADQARREKEIKQRNKWAQEKIQFGLENYVNYNKIDIFRSQWEIADDRRKLYSQVQWEVDKILEKRKVELLERRKRLKNLIETENQMYINEETVQQPTQTQKIARMFERYKNIMIDKELERKKIAEEKQEFQFRKNCDELRTLVSKKLTDLIIKEGKMTQELRNKMDEERDIEDQFYNTMWLKDAEAKKLKHEEQEAIKKARNMAYGKPEKDNSSKSLENKFDNPLTDQQLLKEQLELIEIEKEWEKCQKLVNQERIKKDLDVCLKDKLKRRAYEVQQDLMLDLYFLERIIDRDKERKIEIEKKNALKKDQEKYMAFLREQIKRESEYEKEVEKLQNDACEIMWEKREKEWETQKNIRDVLNKKATRECFEQIRNRMQQSREVQEMKMKYDEEVKKQSLIDQEIVEKEYEFKRAKNIKNQEKLLEQIREREEDAKREKQRKIEEQENVKKAQKAFETKVQNILANPEIDFFHPWRLAKEKQKQNRLAQ